MWRAIHWPQELHVYYSDFTAGAINAVSLNMEVLFIPLWSKGLENTG
jgi:hypothetical protein